MARFSLRHKDKIIESLGLDYYNLLIESLTKFFQSNITIEEHTIADFKEHKVIFVPSVYPNSEIDFIFIIVGKTFDVYNLAYYSAVG